MFPKATNSSEGSGILDAMSSAGCDMKTAPTRTIRNTEKTRMNSLVPLPRYSPMISGRLLPLSFKDITPATKSCIAPMNIPPRVIHRKATGPYAAPNSAPKMGPRPAMFSNWIRNTFQRGIGM